MWTAEEVADWILVRHNTEMLINDAEEQYITQMKLHKLMYYAQGVYLALNGQRLFDEELLAWQHGPVVRSIYDKFKGLRELTEDNLGEEERINFQKISRDVDSKTILEAVYQTFGKYTAGRLRKMTHEETPWIEAWEAGMGSEQISDQSIKEYFEDNIVTVE